MPNSISLAAIFRWVLCVVIFALDQATKYWARVSFSLPNGEPDYLKSMPILGDWLHFRLVYNTGAAFGMKPQNAIPFLNPTIFFTLFSFVAIVLLIVYYRKLDAKDWSAKLGVVLILSGAFGNLFDRIQFHRVTDFIDAGIPGFYPRWPTFNIADSSVCIGMGCLLLLPLLIRKPSNANAT